MSPIQNHFDVEVTSPNQRYTVMSGLSPLCTDAANPKKATIMFIALLKGEQVGK